MSERLVLLVLLGIVVGMLHVIAFWRRKAGEAAYAAARKASLEDERDRYCRMAVMAGHRDACRMFCCMYPDRFDDRHPLKPFKFRGIRIAFYDYYYPSRYSKYSINSLVYWVTYVHNVVYSFYRSMIYCYINSTQRCAGSIVIDIIPTNGADKRKFFPFAPYFPVTNVIKRYFYPYFPAIIGIKGYSFPYFPYLSGIMKIKTALYSLFSRLDWYKTVVFACLGGIYEGIRSLSWEIPVA